MTHNVQLRDIFPSSHSTWAIVWLGSITLETGDHQARIALRVAPLKDDIDITAHPSWHPRLLDWTQSIVTSVPIGLLGKIEIGSIWAVDNDLATRVGTFRLEERTETLAFDNNTLRLVQANRNRRTDSGTRYLIPKSAYPLGRTGLPSPLVAIAKDNYPYRYLIPSIELIRFYYGGSSELYHAIFSPGIGTEHDPVFDRRLSEIDSSGVIRLHLRPPIRLSDARIVAPWIDPYAAQQAARIFGSLLTEAPGKPIGYPATYPPFLGQTQLRVQGISIDTGQYERFLVLRIMQGNLPIPGNEIRLIDPEHALAVGQGEPGEGKMGPGDKPGTGSVPSEIKIPVSGRYPPGSTRTKTATEPEPDRFFEQVSVHRIETPVASHKPGKTGSRPKEDPGPQEIDGAVGPQDPGFDNQKVKVILDPKRPRAGRRIPEPSRVRTASNVSFETIIKGLDKLSGDAKDKPFAYRLVSITSETQPTPWGELGYFPTEYRGRSAKGSMIKLPEGKLRRLLLVCEIRYQDQLFTILDAQRKPGEQFKLAIAYALKPNTPVPLQFLTNLSAKAAAHNCVWKHDPTSSIRVQLMNHTWGDDHQIFANRLQAKLDKSIILRN